MILEVEDKIFEKLIDFNIPILFIITNTPYDANTTDPDSEVEEERSIEKNKIKNVINNSIRAAFKNRLISAEKVEEFINKYTRIFFINSVRKISNKVPVFGIDKVLSYFTYLVPKNNWDDLLECCNKRDDEKYKTCCKDNIFMNSFKEFDKIKERNKKKALNYLDNLQKKALFTGSIPIIDIGFEYYYRYLFTEKLKSLFGFDYEKAENMRNSYNSKLSINENTPLNSNNDKKNNTYKLEQKIEKKIDAGISNKIRNVLSIAGRGVLLKSFNLICWPVSFAVGGAWSYKNIELDCLNILKNF